MPYPVNFLTGQIIGSAIEVHRTSGPGLLESAYRESLARELFLRSFSIKTKWPIPLKYKGMRINKAYEADLIVEDTVVIETKAVEALHPVHEAQLMTYLRLGGLESGTANKLQCGSVKGWHSSQSVRPRGIDLTLCVTSAFSASLWFLLARCASVNFHRKKATADRRV